MRTPDFLMGKHFELPGEVHDAVRQILRREVGLPHGRVIEFENSGRVRVYESPPNEQVLVLIPVPHLVVADVSTSDIEEAIAPCCTNFDVRVEIASPPNRSTERSS